MSDSFQQVLADLIGNTITLEPNLKNALVCKMWYKHLKKGLDKKKVCYYDEKIYNLVVNKVYYKTSKNECKLLEDNETIMFTDTIYSKMLAKIIKNVLKECEYIQNTVKEHMIYYHNIHEGTVMKFKQDNFYSRINDNDKHIMLEYRFLLSLYFDYDITDVED
jgi:hypothetical protein